MSPRWQLISFDLDGTLVDTADEIAEAANRALADCGLPEQPPARVRALIGGGTHELVRRLLALGVHARPLRTARLPVTALYASFEQHYDALAGTHASPYPGARETLAVLAGAGVRLACVTNKETRFVERVLRGTGLDDAFDMIVCGDTLPERKPHPRVLGHVLERLGVAPAAAAHVGDSRIDVESARNAGVADWAVPWGYNAGEPIAAAVPQRLFASLPEIARFALAAPQPAGCPSTTA